MGKGFARLRSRLMGDLFAGRKGDKCGYAANAETGSRRAAVILQNWEVERGKFVQVCPKEMLAHLAHPLGVRGRAGHRRGITAPHPCKE